MINHVRTLLLNRPADGAVSSQQGEEYVPADFTPKTLTPPLRRWRQAVFGSRPDRVFLNFRVRQLLQLLHASPLAPDAYLDDSRVTYLPFDTAMAASGAISLQQWAGSDSGAVVAGQYAANEATGQATHTWQVVVNPDLSVTVTDQTTQKETTFPDDTTIALPSSSLQLYLQQKASGQKFSITAIAMPQTDLSQVLRNGVDALGPEGLTEIFRNSAHPAQAATWLQVWQKQQIAIERYAALLLAIAAYTAQLPQEQADE